MLYPLIYKSMISVTIICLSHLLSVGQTLWHHIQICSV